MAYFGATAGTGGSAERHELTSSTFVNLWLTATRTPTVRVRC